MNNWQKAAIIIPLVPTVIAGIKEGTDWIWKPTAEQAQDNYNDNVRIFGSLLSECQENLRICMEID